MPPPASNKTKGTLNHPVPELMHTSRKKIENKEGNMPDLGLFSLIFGRALR